MTAKVSKCIGFNLLCFMLIILLGEYKELVTAQDNNGFYPGYVGALNDTINNLMTQLQVYQQYIDQAFQPLNTYDKIFKKPMGSFSAGDTSKGLETSKRVQTPSTQGQGSIDTMEKPGPPTLTQEKPSDSIDELLSTISAEVDEMDKGTENKDTYTRIEETRKTKKTESPSPGTLSFIDSGMSPQRNYHNIDDRIQPIKISNPEPAPELTNSPSTSTTPCGIFDPSLLVGKSRRNHIQWPWMTSVGKQYKSGFLYKCGGTIINGRTILTSAHCFDAQSDLDTADIAGTKLPIANITIHPEYKKGTGYNDIAIVRLASPIEPKANITSVCVPPNFQKSGSVLDKADSFSWSSEWAYRNEDGVLSLKVKNVHTRILNSSFCEDEIRRTNSDLQAMFPKGYDSTLLCVKSSRGRLCQGNAGASLFTRDKSGTSFLIGNTGSVLFIVDSLSRLYLAQFESENFEIFYGVSLDSLGQLRIFANFLHSVMRVK